MDKRDYTYALLGFVLGIVVLFATTLFVGYAKAQDAVAGAASQSSLNSNIQAGAVAQGMYVAGSPQRKYTELATVGQQSAPGFSSGHPCGYAPLSVGAGIVGYGLSAGGQTIDDACLLAQMGFSQEAMMMIAARNASACEALRTSGKIAASSECAGRNGFRRDNTVGTTVATKSPAPRPAIAYTKCELNADGAVVIRVKNGETAALAASQCKATLGVR